MIQTEVRTVTLKELIKAKPEYFRIMVAENKIIAHTEIRQKIGNQLETVWVWYDAPMPLMLTAMGSNDQERKRPKILNLHWGHAKTFLTLLEHYPDSLEITYWVNGGSELNRTKGLNLEAIYIKGYTKKGKHEIELTQNYESLFQTIGTEFN
jgi:hypothetical protein